jgi:thiamine-phosphate pyrophosphorylase
MISYLITDPKYYTNNPQIFRQKLIHTLEIKEDIDFICFRDKVSKNYNELIKIFLEISNKFNKKAFINSYIDEAIKYNSYGIHLNSQQFHLISKLKKNNQKIIISTHNENEIKKAIKLQSDFITYSPIFFTPNKDKPKSVKNLEYIQKKYNIKIIALGGIISQEHIKELKEINCFGFASIRYFI